MAEYRLTNKAVSDLENIWDYTVNKWSEKQADVYYKMLIEHFQQIAQSPDLGKRYDNVKSGLLGFQSGRHVIFYSFFKDIVVIKRILHGRMDFKRRLGG
jgi:toxin ParE1/3/4